MAQQDQALPDVAKRPKQEELGFDEIDALLQHGEELPGFQGASGSAEESGCGMAESPARDYLPDEGVRDGEPGSRPGRSTSQQTEGVIAYTQDQLPATKKKKKKTKTRPQGQKGLVRLIPLSLLCWGEELGGQ